MPGTPTTKHALPTVNGSTDLARDIDTAINNLAAAVDSKMVGYGEGTLASRPTSSPGSPGVTGREYYAIDTDQRFKDTGTSWVEISKVLAVVTSLPASPQDGQECLLLADAANGVVWHLKYRAASSSAYKWEFIGGNSLRSEVATEELRIGATYGDLATVGPQITLPLAGDYIVSGGAHAWISGTGASQVFAAVKLGTAATADTEALAASYTIPQAVANAQGGQSSREILAAARAAADVLKMQYRASAGTGVWTRRWLAVRPRRVG